MKKGFKFYAVCWAILLAVFNVICFATPNEAAGMTKFGGAFWAGYVFITLAFIGQLVCAYFAFKADNNQKFFYNLPLITISYTGLILTVIFGALCMAIPNLPNWAGVIVCLLILAFNAIAVIKAVAAAEIVSGVEEKVKAQTQFVKLATVNAQNIMNRAETETAKAECKKVYEALRYSDPMSNDALSVDEAKITVKLDELSAAVTAKADTETSTPEADSVSEIAKEIVLLVKERNNRCKILKG